MDTSSKQAASQPNKTGNSKAAASTSAHATTGAPEAFDAIVVGAGQAGPPLVRRLTAAGQRVALVERQLLGGTCVNYGCTPTKAMIASAEVAFKAQNATRWGVHADAVSVDFAAVQQRRDEIVAESRDGLEKSLRENENVTLFAATARFIAPRTLQVGDRSITAPRIFLNVGARAAVPKLDGVDTVPFLTSSSLLALRELPEHLVIVGGSYIALEFAQMYRRFGSRVTVVERQSRLAAREDEDISQSVREVLEAEGIIVRTSAECIALAPHADGVAVHTNCTRDAAPVIGSHVLLATGRRPNTDDLGCDAGGIALDDHGYIRVDDQLQTSAAGVWALGDCNGCGAFTHTAYNDFEIVAANLLDGGERRVADRIACWAMYTDPPLAHIGLGEQEVRSLGREVLTASMPMSRVNRAREKGETLGRMKVFVDAGTQQILGAVIFGTAGDEAIHALLATMYARAPYTAVSQAVYIHPTLSELLPTLLQSLKPLA